MHIWNRSRRSEARFGIAARRGHWRLFRLNAELQKRKRLDRFESLADALKGAKRRGRRKANVSLIYVSTSRDNWELWTFAIGRFHGAKTVLGATVLNGPAIPWVFPTIGFYVLVLCFPASFENLQLLTLPAALLVASSLTILGVLAVDRQGPWSLRGELLRNTVGLVAASLITVVVAIVFEALSVPECPSINGENGNQGCDLKTQQHTHIYASVGGILLTSAVMTVSQILRLALGVFFYSEMTRRDRQV